ncbi:MAG: type II toxin-antitoxin system VapC family toxin [Syntrophothermus sp.]|uniref:type II toxin-antitoxin system VapC family toxin n=1 Tax=Syntrophothermus sp. TaxID=2736299 RepID=UPI00257B789B|nr:type II toxin-antitoxin system VapC family toxin [Syntrophothermus sp.]NSW81661.1 type II toxin-antitoxin system VapC family toxin [Syntrophothermus sp.]
MRALLDTHAFLWWITDDPKLSRRAREIIEEGKNVVFFSAASGWEMAIKAGLGKLIIPGDVRAFVMEQLAVNGVSPLPVDLIHALHVFTLPLIHRDPFDRLLIAQAQIENLPILTADPQISRYDVEVIW